MIKNVRSAALGRSVSTEMSNSEMSPISADDEDIIQNVSFRIKSGQTVGILGSTGSGKSTHHESALPFL